MINPSKTILLLILVIFISATGLTQRLGLQDAVSIALKNSLNIRLGKNYVEIASINNNYGIAGGLPVLTATGNDNEQTINIRQQYSNPANNKNASNVSSNNFSAGLAAGVLLSNGQRVVNTKKRLGIVEDQSKEQLDSRIQLVVAGVMLKYYDILRQQSYAFTLENSIEVSKQKLDIVKTQQSVGMANDADLFQAEVDLNTQIQTLGSQQLVVDQDKMDLLTLLNLPADSMVIIADTILVDKNIRLDTILNNLPSNPDLIAADRQVDINRFIEKEIAAERYPSLNLNAGYNFSRNQNAAGFTLLNQNYGPYASVGLFIPIFNGGIYRRQQQIAGINIKNAQMQKDTLLLNYRANIFKNWQAYLSSLQLLEKAQENYVLSQKLLDLVLKRFKLRQATIVEVKNAQQSFENSGYILINISYAAKAAEIQLKRYANKLEY
jgi:outer membrane protein